jgi:very-short-patch-repair endonuclease
MDYSTHQSPGLGAWALARAQHGVVSHGQLVALGYGPQAIKHRVAKGRLHPVARGVYAVGRPQLTRYGRWMAAVLSCGPDAVLSHASAAALWEIGSQPTPEIHLSLPLGSRRRRPGIVIHRRKALTDQDVTRHHGIPVTTPIATLIDIAPTLTRDELEAAINDADKHGLTDPDQLRATLDEVVHWPGAARLRETLDRRTFTLTDSALERRFLALARKAGLPAPRTQQRVNGFKADFHWPDLKLIVETDGLRYHRTPAQQTKDRLRDQTHTGAGLTPLRFTHAQIHYDPDHVVATLRAVAQANALPTSAAWAPTAAA